MNTAIKGKFGPNLQRPLHLGHLRVALVNTAYVKVRGAGFVLRLEDTATFESEPVTSVEDVCIDLAWGGVVWTEGLGRGGPKKPYVQSERFELYLDTAERLISLGNAYVCDCSQERLDALRRRQIESGSPFRGYDGYCRDRGLPWDHARSDVLRFSVPKREGEVKVFDSLRYRTVKKSFEQIEDFILVRSSGVPTYYLACAVDDNDMGVNLMLRANEGEGSALRLKLVRESLGFQTTFCGFLPIIKADGGLGRSIPSLGSLRRMGVDGERLAVYLLSLGLPKMFATIDEAFNYWASDAPLKGSSGRTPAISTKTIESLISTSPSKILSDKKVEALVGERDEARRHRQYERADSIRFELEAGGISVSDGLKGTHWKRMRS